MKIDKDINLSQLTEELLSKFGISSLVYDIDAKELKVKSVSGPLPTEAEILKAVKDHAPKKVKTKAERRDAVKDATNLDELKVALLELI